MDSRNLDNITSTRFLVTQQSNEPLQLLTTRSIRDQSRRFQRNNAFFTRSALHVSKPIDPFFRAMLAVSTDGSSLLAEYNPSVLEAWQYEGTTKAPPRASELVPGHLRAECIHGLICGHPSAKNVVKTQQVCETTFYSIRYESCKVQSTKRPASRG